jgi:hypothetical protein
MIDNEYFSYRTSERASHHFFRRLFREVWSKATNDGLTKEDGKLLSGKLQRKVDTVRTQLSRGEVVKQVSKNNYVMVAKQL